MRLVEILKLNQLTEIIGLISFYQVIVSIIVVIVSLSC